MGSGMNKTEAVEVLQDYRRETRGFVALEVSSALDLAIEALQFAEHFDLLKEYQSLQDVVYCKDCKWEFICRQTVEQANADDIEHRTLVWCSFGERKNYERFD